MKKTTTLSKICALLVVLLTCGAMTAQITNYGIKIAGTELTSANAGAINNTNFPKLGLAEGGSITYDHSEKTFTLTGVTANVNSVRFMRISDSAEKADYTINLVGTNAITNNGGGATIATYRNLIVEGSGSLKVTSDDCGILIYNDTLTIKNTTIEAIGRWGITANGGSSNEHLIIEKANVTATGAEGSICDFQSITLTDCEIIQPEGAINNGHAVMLSGSVVKTEVKIKADNIIIHYDGDNDQGIGANGSAATFTVAIRLTNDELESYYNSHKITQVRYYIYGTEATSTTIKIYGDGTAIAPGELLVDELTSPPQEGWNTHTLSTPLLITSGDYWVGYEVVTTGGYPAGVDAGPAIAGKGDWIYLEGDWGEISNYGLNYNWNIRAILTPVPVNYGIEIAGTELTSDNAGAINNTNFPNLGLEEGGTITYDHSEKTFTLTGVTANVNSARFMQISDSAEEADYTINLVGNNDITSNFTSIALYRNLIVTGSGSLKVTSSGNCGFYVEESTLTIRKTTVEAKGNWGIAGNDGSSNEHLIIEKANVTATGAEGSICDFQSITLTNCEIIQPEGAINDGNSIVLGGSVVTSEVKISPTTGLSTLAAEGIYVWGERGEISIEIPGSASKRTAHIYNVSGMLVRTLPLQGTKEYVTVPAGIYIVRIGTAIEKVVVR
ncbi:MAG TPA: hypothetical protein PK984_03885 [Paludibacteraceae bacterium]|nr:hypothetical protein [Paludibacteraceae bacterium]HOS37338.1 hypothetical protein [Paludibacteraceae bacterium]